MTARPGGNAGLLLPATLARQSACPNPSSSAWTWATARDLANAGDKMMNWLAWLVATACPVAADCGEPGGRLHSAGGWYGWADTTLGSSCAASGGATSSTRPGEPRVHGPLAGRGRTQRRARLTLTCIRPRALRDTDWPRRAARHHGYTGKRGFTPCWPRRRAGGADGPDRGPPPIPVGAAVALPDVKR